MRRFKINLLVLFLVSLSSCQFLKPVENEWPIKSRFITYIKKILITPIKFTKKIDLIILLPADYEKRQIVHEMSFSKEPARIFFDGENKYAEFVIENFSWQEQIIITSKIELFEYDLNTVTRQINRGIRDYSEDKLKKYLIDEKYLEKDNPLIQKIAKDINSSAEIEIVKKIYDFVLSHMEYKGYKPKDKGALYALVNKSSDCTEYSDLFIALCRAKNIPARGIEEFTLYGSNYKHNWAEVYIKGYGWIPFDPMNDDTGFLRADFYNLLNVYLYLSFIRNDNNLDGYHFAMWRF